MSDNAKGFIIGMIVGLIFCVGVWVLSGCTHPHGPQVIPPIKYERTGRILSMVFISTEPIELDDVRSSTMTTSDQYPDYSMERDYDAWLLERQGRQ